MNGKEPGQTTRLIESEAFPFEFVSALAERESWRKEIYRPIYHVHKWWAKRLGSVFRSILLGGVLPEGEDLEDAFYRVHELSQIVVFDPFMGSGTTVGEANKLGMTVLGRDINPVASEAVRVAFSPISREQLMAAFQYISDTAGRKIRELYRAKDKDGNPCTILYYFWVKQVQCHECQTNVDLFSSYVFAQNAYPKQKPEVQVYCPGCHAVFSSLYHKTAVTCPHCATTFNPKNGPAKGANATCCACNSNFPIVTAIRNSTHPPDHKLYAKLVLLPTGRKIYLPATQEDNEAYSQCEQQLKTEIEQGAIRLPDSVLFAGYNTRQAMNYNFKLWRDFFNARQLLALGWLHEAILNLPDNAERDALLSLFSGTLEFNNLFTSYKGEGTGAVRHMFSHHTLKPERMPIEANIWGTTKSSGSFSGLFRSRLLRALEYRESPFEVGMPPRQKVFGASQPMGLKPLDRWGNFAPGRVALSCGDSASTHLVNESVDLIVTDPPFFDNVHYSELADFFYAWQYLHPRGFISQDQQTTRHHKEVQDTDPEQFALKLRSVFVECHRVLKKSGLLVFTYHHSRPDGWLALAKAVYGAEFAIVQAHPVRAELANATPKAQTKEPILLDAIIVCRKRESNQDLPRDPEETLETAVTATTNQIKRLIASGYTPTEGDKFVIGAAQLFAALGPKATEPHVLQTFAANQVALQNRLRLIDVATIEKPESQTKSRSAYEQLTLAL